MPRGSTLFALWTVLPLTALLLHSGCVIDELTETEVGDAAICEAARRWPNAYAEREDELLRAVNRARARGGMCADLVQNPVEDLAVAPELHCAARMHAVDLARRGTLDHVGSDGSTTVSRVDDAHYSGVPLHELLAADFLHAQDVLDAWLASPEHCVAIYASGVDELGIGHAQSDNGDAAAWVLLTAQQLD